MSTTATLKTPAAVAAARAVETVINRGKEVASCKVPVRPGEVIDRRKPQNFPEAASVGDFVRQGDVMILRAQMEGKKHVIRDSKEGKVGIRKMDTVNLQLAPGNTPGSRHILDSGEGVTMYTLAEANEYDGAILALEKKRTLNHPEHGAFVLPPGVYAIRFQRTVDMDEKQRRARD